ncbi:hypothetical protein KGD82_07515 [Nocardiopsis eucommiae]|uniref:Erythromycin biosynthesis protein CIII-like C-terminal domain-containing protein n=1 Tax=Nocardiopsis eucommiae TaxID=2831970 RepID=A0A975LBD3_9ACTN|nr:hypothetical protein KGD82_07515 [Nocardiopsis eucommiae]
MAGLDVEVVATLDAGQLESMRLPDNVRAVEFVPLNVLLPTCSAIVHHGGSGTVAAALEHAVPQLIVPAVYWSDKFYGPVASANGLEEQGAGIYVADSDRLTAADLRAQLDRVLSEPSFEENARRLSAEAREVPTPNDLVPLLEGLTGRFARPARPTKERTS